MVNDIPGKALAVGESPALISEQWNVNPIK
jgi:hypothetical protein